MVRILNAEPDNYCDAARRMLRSLGDLTEVRCSQVELLRLVPEFDVLIVRLGLEVDRQVIDVGTRLRAIVTAATGLDHIDVSHAEAKGIAVLSLRGETEFLRSIPATAEHSWGLLLALVRHIPGACASVVGGDWDRDALRGHDLAGKRLGIVGLGRIGERVARYGDAFGMDVAAYDPYRLEWVPGVGRCNRLPELLERCDVLSIHVPLNAETTGMIGRNELASLPSQAWLINTSRGAVLDEVALVQALESGGLRGAALDVLEGELDPMERRRSPLLSYARTHDNLLITPHVGGATIESMARTEVFMAQKLAQHIGGLRA